MIRLDAQGCNGDQTFHEIGFTVGQQVGASESIGGSYTTVQQWGNVENIIMNIGQTLYDAEQAQEQQMVFDPYDQ